MISHLNAIAGVLAAWEGSRYSDAIDQALHEDAGHEETRELASLFRGKSWDEVPESILLAEYPSPWTLNDQAFRYYLPAFLIAAINHPDEMTSRLLGSLDVPKKTKALMRFRERFAGLSLEQIRAVACTLEYLGDAVTENTDWARKRIDILRERFWDTGCAQREEGTGGARLN